MRPFRDLIDWNIDVTMATERRPQAASADVK